MSIWRKNITLWLCDNLDHGVFDPVVESQKLIKNYDEEEFRECDGIEEDLQEFNKKGETDKNNK